MTDEEREAAMEVIFDLARETLKQHDLFVERGWVMNDLPHEAAVRAILARPKP